MPMKSLDTGKDKIQKICDMLKRETLEPAQAEAATILGNARKEAQEILQEAEKKAQGMEKAARERIAKEKSVFESSMEQGVRQSVEMLRQGVEQKLFQQQLGELVSGATGDPQLIAHLINALVEAVEKEGITTDLTAVVPKAVKAEEVNGLLLAQVKEKLKGGVTVGEFKGGAQIKLVDKKITIDVSDEALQELMGRFLRKDYRALLFGKGV